MIEMHFPCNWLPSGIGIFPTTLMQIAVESTKWEDVACCWLLAVCSAAAFWFITPKKGQATSPQCDTRQTQPGGLCPFLVCLLEGRIMLEH